MDDRHFKVDENAARLDVFLAARVPGLTRKKARELCEKGAVEVNGKSARAGLALKLGDIVRMLEPFREVTARPELGASAGVSLHFEDENILVVNKPRSMASIRLRNEDPPTVADWLGGYCSDCINASPDPREAGLVQRLDFYTSGLLLAAKNRLAWEALRKQLFAEEVEKTYLAIVEKQPPKKRFTVSFPLVQSRDSKSMCVVREPGAGAPIQLSAVTEVSVVSMFERGGQGFSLVRAKGRRVRRHQIRAHLASTGHPLVGDQLYGSTTQLSEIIPELGEGFLLHAESIHVRHPLKAELFEFNCDSPYCIGLGGAD